MYILPSRFTMAGLKTSFASHSTLLCKTGSVKLPEPGPSIGLTLSIFTKGSKVQLGSEPLAVVVFKVPAGWFCVWVHPINVKINKVKNSRAPRIVLGLFMIFYSLCQTALEFSNGFTRIRFRKPALRVTLILRHTLHNCWLTWNHTSRGNQENF